MASRYWLKLYHEMLDDPKVARLPDSSYRRFIECMLLAGEVDEGGYLPSIEDMAWRLRRDETSLRDDMSRLATAQLVEIKEDGRWFVTKFSDRQKAVSGAERVKRHRDNAKKQEYNAVDNGPVTKRYTDTDTDTDKIQIADTESPAGAAFTAYGDNIGGLTPIISTELGELIDEHGADTVTEAIHEAVKYNGRSLKYITAILTRWERDGKNSKKQKSTIYPEIKGFMTGSKPYKDLSPPAQEFVKAHGGNDLKQIRPNSFEDNQIKKEAESYAQ